MEGLCIGVMSLLTLLTQKTLSGLVSFLVLVASSISIPSGNSIVMPSSSVVVMSSSASSRFFLVNRCAFISKVREILVAEAPNSLANKKSLELL